ncbi:MAG: carboxymuconolactone decarboxylase family protein, partial [Sphingomonadales bacterium]|nr:carboxymuconolactone decarboxylase family protein [Sphingomonadales bacterium]
MTDEIEARHAQVFGDGPRVKPLANDAVDEATWEMVNTIRASVGAGCTEVMPVFMRVMAKHPAIFRRQMEMGTTLFTGLIPARDREVAVLRIAWLAGAAVEWGEHVEIAKRVGFSGDEIERIKLGSAAPEWSRHEAVILRAVEELLAGFVISDAVWNVLAQNWSEAQLIEFPMIVGQYLT